MPRRPGATPKPMRWIADADPLPSTAHALSADSDAPGLLALGGRVTVERLEEAYRKGVFPWYGPELPPMWWTPDPRMVLPVAQFKLSASLRKTLRRFVRTPGCEVRVDGAFDEVIAACAQAPRDGQKGTWIVPELQAAYAAWHRAGRVHSFETWIAGELAGGLYGVGIGRMFFGESMFARRTDASKIALAALVAFCREHHITLIDCQQHTGHLARLGAREISRAEFEDHLSRVLGGPAPTAWSYHPRLWAQLDLGAPLEQSAA
jgi:leucyl/phenylalanyl-tRNA---protein transferase